MRVTLSLPDDTIALARLEAAKSGMSLSGWIAGQVAQWLEESGKLEMSAPERPSAVRREVDPMKASARRSRRSQR